MNIVKAREELYRFFPRNVNPMDSAFDATAETKNKWMAVPERRSQIQSRWKEFIDEMNKLFPDQNI